jgi:hypothetical protein
VFAPGVISSDFEEYRIVFTPDDRTAYFGRAAEFFPSSRQATIFVTRLGDDGWGVPVTAPFSGEYSDIDPFISPDGSRLYFSSIRPADGVERADVELWMVERTPEGWGEPTHLSEVGSEFDELYPSVDAAGNLYFGTDRPRAPGAPRTWNLWRAPFLDGRYGQPEVLDAGVNSDDAWEFNPAISADGRRLVFTRLDRRDARGTGFGEIMVAHWDGEWSHPRPIGPPVNSPLDEFHPSFSGDGEWFFFLRRDPLDPDARGDIFRVAVSAVPGLERPPHRRRERLCCGRQ